MHSVNDTSSGQVSMNDIHDLRDMGQLLFSTSEMDREEIKRRFVQCNRRRRMA
jgi:hypothetical protein